MFWLIESEDQLRGLQNRKIKESFVEIIPHSHNIHPAKNSICAIYIRPLNSHVGYIITISHEEAFQVDTNTVEQLLDTHETIYVRDKKEFIHYLPIKGLIDSSLPPYPYIPELTPTHHFFYSKKQYQNTLIPLSKHHQYCEKIFNDLKPFFGLQTNKFFNTKATLVFNSIEKNPIKIDKKEFEKHFYTPQQDSINSYFNFKTLTTRPSNKFGGINLAALNKSTGQRKAIIPANDILFEIDISAYHPLLLGKLVGYRFKHKDIHREFAKIYNVEYKKAKQLTFRQIYGGVFEEYKGIEFFSRVEKYTEELWEKFNSQGYIEVPISGYRFDKKIYKDMNPQKLLNYLLQALETALNVVIMEKIIRLLANKSTRLISYTYDSFLFDVDKKDKPTIKQIMGIFESYGLNIKYEYGYTYDFG
jgi:hypothetical protein